MNNKTTLRNNLKRAIAKIEQFDADTAQLWKNVATFSNCQSNPFHDEAIRCRFTFIMGIIYLTNPN
jgi:hypothetical protein